MVINMYKEKDWTSFDVVAKVKGILGGKKSRKVGHAGTLDPLAEGVLLILTDEDTKKQDQIMSLEKEYVCEIAFGAQSITYDLEGELTFDALPPSNTDLKANIEKHLPKYLGQIEQQVPPYSAAKVGGKKLYIEARKGNIKKTKLPVKKVTIHKIELLDFYKQKLQAKELPVAKLKITCSKGTYVRSIANDLGNDLGVGGVLVSLVRTRVGKYKVEDSLKISELLARLALSQ